MNTFAEPSSVVALLGFAIPLTLAAVAVVAPARAAPASVAALGMALLFAAGVALGGGGTRFGVGGDGVASVMLVLVAALGAVVVRYSQTYLQGDPSRRLLHYQRWLLLTLAAVTGLVVASNLLVIALAWTATSLALHRLLTFYADRPLARVAAHKKFVVSRLYAHLFKAM